MFYTFFTRTSIYLSCLPCYSIFYWFILSFLLFQHQIILYSLTQSFPMCYSTSRYLACPPCYSNVLWFVLSACYSNISLSFTHLHNPVRCAIQYPYICPIFPNTPLSSGLSYLLCYSNISLSFTHLHYLVRCVIQHPDIWSVRSVALSILPPQARMDGASLSRTPETAVVVEPKIPNPNL